VGVVVREEPDFTTKMQGEEQAYEQMWALL